MKYYILCLVMLSALTVFSQTTGNLTQPNPDLAAKFSPQKLGKLIHSTEVNPNWINFGDKFWYEYTTTEGKKWYLVDPKNKKKSELFHHAEMAAKITSIVRNPFDSKHLNILNLQFMEDENFIRFQVQSTKDTVKSAEEIKKLTNKKDTIKKKLFYLEYNLSNQELRELSDTTKEKSRQYWASFNPDTSKVYYAKNYNIYWMDYANFEKARKDEKDSTIVEHQITKDGVQYYAWGGDEYSVTSGDKKSQEEEKNKRKPVRISWSPNGKYFSLTRKDNRDYQALWVINNVGGSRPTLETYKYQMPGEMDSTEVELYVFNVSDYNPKRINVSAFKNQTITLWNKDRSKESYMGKHYINYWLGNNEEFYLSRSSRDLKRIELVQVQIDGQSKTLVKEEANVYLDNKKPYFIPNTNQFIHWSQKDGWGHFYRYDKNGNLLNQITKGEFHCDELIHYDATTEKLYFKANGRENDIDPYYNFLYTVRKDGTGMKLLTPGDFDHQILMSESGQYFIDNYSRVNTAPVSKLYASNGNLLINLEETDLTQLFESGYKFPEPFKVKAGDGITDLYGVMYKPFDFDSTKTYPIIEYVYPGPQTEAVNKSFGRSMDRIDRLAQMGFIVVSVGNRGGHPSRSKWYHTYGYGNLRDYGLEDKKVVVEQLANKYDFIEIGRAHV